MRRELPADRSSCGDRGLAPMRPVIVQNRLVIGWRPALIDLSESDASDIIGN